MCVVTAAPASPAAEATTAGSAPGYRGHLRPCTATPFTSLLRPKGVPPKCHCARRTSRLFASWETPRWLRQPLRPRPALAPWSAASRCPPPASTGAAGQVLTEDAASGLGQAPEEVTQGIRAAPSPQGSGPLQRNPHPRQPATPPRDGRGPCRTLLGALNQDPGLDPGPLVQGWHGLHFSCDWGRPTLSVRQGARFWLQTCGDSQEQGAAAWRGPQGRGH